MTPYILPAWNTLDFLLIFVTIVAITAVVISLTYREKYIYNKHMKDVYRKQGHYISKCLTEAQDNLKAELAKKTKLPEVSVFVAYTTEPTLGWSENWYQTALVERARWISMMEGFNECIRLTGEGKLSDAQDILVKTMLGIMNAEYSPVDTVTKPQDSYMKYAIYGSSIRNIKTGEAIPVDEPVFIIRGKDPIGPKILLDYAHQCKSPEAFKAVAGMAVEFEHYQAKHK